MHQHNTKDITLMNNDDNDFISFNSRRKITSHDFLRRGQNMTPEGVYEKKSKFQIRIRTIEADER